MDYEYNELFNLAEIIKDSFFQRKSAQKGKPYKPHPKFTDKDLWVEIARVCKKLGADPNDFLDAAFRHNAVPQGPFPTQLKGEAIERWYADHAAGLKADNKDNTTVLSGKVDLEIKAAIKACLKRNEREKVDPVKTLFNPIMKIPPYVRIILMKNSLESMVRFGEEVHEYIKISPGLKEVLEQKGLNLKLMYECNGRKHK
tara:strand:+ start:2800 stop:3399 length:600 start_codon:yes stop_codon:yes gene_type:complete